MTKSERQKILEAEFKLTFICIKIPHCSKPVIQARFGAIILWLQTRAGTCRCEVGEVFSSLCSQEFKAGCTVVVSRCVQPGSLIVQLYDSRQIFQQLPSYSISLSVKPSRVVLVVAIKRDNDMKYLAWGTCSLNY